MNYHDADGDLACTDTFTHPCVDCGKTIRVVNGKSRRHWCRMPRHLRGKIGKAWAEGYQWGLSDGRGDDVLVRKAAERQQRE